MNNLKELLDKIDNLIDLSAKDPDFVCHHIPKSFILLQKKYDEISTIMIKLKSKLEIEEQKYLDYLKHKADFLLSNKDEIRTYINGDEKINKINKAMRICERDLKTIENRIKLIMNLNFTIKNIIDYKNFKNGDV